MIDNTPLSFPLDISIKSTVVRISLTDSDQLRAVYELPPIEEIVLIQKMASGKVSMQENVKSFQKDSQDLFYDEYLRLLERYDKFETSATYLNHLSLLLERSGRMEESQGFLERAARLSTTSYLKGRYAVNQLKKAFNATTIARLEELTKDDDVYALINLSLAYLSQHDIGRAIATADRAVNTDPMLFQSRLLRGSLFLVKGERQKAIRDLRVAIEAKPDSSIAHANISIAHLYMRNLPKALLEAEKSLSLNPVDRNIVALLSDLYLIRGKYERVISIIGQYIQYDQKEADLWDRLAKAYFHLGKYQLSMETLRHESSVQDGASVWNNMAIVAIATREVAKAKQYFSRAWDMSDVGNMSDTIAANYFGFLRKQGLSSRIKELSITIIDKYLAPLQQVTAESAEIVLSHILSLYESGEKAEAIQIAEKYVDEHQSGSSALLNILTFLIYHYSMISKNREKALLIGQKATDILEQVSTLDVKARIRVMNNIAYCLLEYGLTDKASEILADAIRYVNDDLFLTATYGYLKIRQGEIAEGLTYYKKAYNKALNRELQSKLHQKMNLEAGRYYASRNKVHEAEAAFREVLKSEGGNELFRKEAESELEHVKSNRN